MVILGAVEDDSPALEHPFVAGLLQVAAAELLRDDAHLHDGEIEQIALQHQEAGTLLQRFRKGADDLAITRLAALQILRHRPARDRRTVSVELAGLQQLPHDGRNAAGAVEAFAEIRTRRLHIGEQRNIEAMYLPVVGMKLDAGVLGHGGQMRLRVGRTADCGIDPDRIEEGRTR